MATYPAHGSANWDEPLKQYIDAAIEGPPGPQGPAGKDGEDGAPGGSDAAFAGWIETPGSDTATALNAAMGDQIATPGTPARERVDQVRATTQADVGRGGRGMISITLDDALPVHFTDVLPVSIAMGFPIGTAWHTDNGQDAQVAAAHAAGWEILSHLPANVDARTLTEAQLIAQAVSSRDKIAAITGNPHDIGFVYPQHLRNDLTDRIFSRYYTWGRGVSSNLVSDTAGHPWVVSAYNFDQSHDTAGNLTEKIKNDLRALARTDGRAAFYGHYNGTSGDAGRVEAIANLVRFARSLGIQVVRPSDVRGAANIMSRGSVVPAEWALGTGASIDATTGIRAGENSFKVTPNAAGGAALTGGITRHSQHRFPVAPVPGAFTIWRMSARYKAPSAITVSANWGIAFGAGLFTRPVNGGAEVAIYGGTPYSSRRFPASGTTIPAADWGLISDLVALGPDVVGVAPVFSYGNIVAGSPAFNVADFKMEKVDTVGSLTYETTLNGTAGVTIKTNVLGVNRCGIALAAKGALAGSLWYETPGSQGDEVRIYSTNSADTTQTVRITITPTISYKDYALSATGA